MTWWWWDVYGVMRLGGRSGARRSMDAVCLRPTLPYLNTTHAQTPTSQQFMKGLFRALVQGTRASNAIPAGAEKGAAVSAGRIE